MFELYNSVIMSYWTPLREVFFFFRIEEQQCLHGWNNATGWVKHKSETATSPCVVCVPRRYKSHVVHAFVEVHSWWKLSLNMSSWGLRPSLWWVGMNITVFWKVAPFNLVFRYQRFRGKYCLHFHGLKSNSFAEDWGSRFLWKFSAFRRDYMASRPIR
jgi:hypothetical protein